MKKKLLAGVLTGALLLSATACSTDSQADGNADVESGDGDHAQITIVLKALNSEYWNCLSTGAKQAAQDLDCDVEIIGPPSETAYDEQYNLIETALSSGTADALVIAPLQPDAAVDAVKSATIPVLAVDTTFPAPNLSTYVGISNENAAYEGGKYMAEKVGSGKGVIILGGVQGDTTSEDRINGWTKGLEEGGCTILGMQYTDALTDKAVSNVESFLQMYPGEISAIVCHSDDVAVGAANAIAQAGLTDEILVCGFGGISGAAPVKAGTLFATVDIGAYDMGYNCVVKALDLVSGNEVEDFYPAEVSIIDAYNVEEFLTKLAQWVG